MGSVIDQNNAASSDVDGCSMKQQWPFIISKIDLGNVSFISELHTYIVFHRTLSVRQYEFLALCWIHSLEVQAPVLFH